MSEAAIDEFLDQLAEDIAHGRSYEGVVPPPRRPTEEEQAEEDNLTLHLEPAPVVENEGDGGMNEEWTQHQEADTKPMDEIRRKLLAEREAEEAARRQRDENNGRYAINQIRQQEIDRNVEVDISELERQVANIEGAQANKLVFFDLEWHTLDKKPPPEMVRLAEANRLISAHVCQIAAFSANYKLKFNQYVSYLKLKSHWTDLAENWNFVQYSPQDDPRIAISAEDCFEAFFELFEEDTLFLSYGSTDASTIFRYLLGSAEYDPVTAVRFNPEDVLARRKAMLEKVKKKRFRWADARHWFKAQSEAMPHLEAGNILVGGSLGKLYDSLFHRSLLVTVPTGKNPIPTIRESNAISTVIGKRVVSFPPSAFDDDEKAAELYGLVPRKWLEVRNDHLRNDYRQQIFQYKNCYPEFWPTGHLQPVFHVAHTDAIMTLNCAVILDIALELQKAAPAIEMELQRKKPSVSLSDFLKAEEVHRVKDQDAIQKSFELAKDTDAHVAQFHFIATTLVAKTWFFRRYQLSMSEAGARRILAWYSGPPGIKINDKGRQVKNRTKNPARYEKSSEEMINDLVEKATLKPSIEDSQLDSDQFEIEKILDERRLNKETQYLVRWKATDRRWADDWLPAKDIQAPQLIDAFKNNTQSTHDDDSDDEATTDELFNAQFERAGRERRTYILINDKKKPLLLQTARTGVFTDKVKAIRDYILLQSVKETDILDSEIHRSFAPQKDPYRDPLSSRRTTDYEGKPWFSFYTSAAGPNTTMLHTMKCRNLSNPRDRGKTRNFSEMNVIVWDFDKLAAAGVRINTRFRFCKECKDFSPVRNLRNSAWPLVNEVSDELAAVVISEAPQPAPVAPPAPLPAQPPERQPSIVSTAAESSSGKSTIMTLSRPAVHRLPLTNIVSYFALKRSESLQ